MIHKKVNILAIVVILLILLFSIYRGFIYSSFLRKQIKVVGLLSVVTSCVIPEGCGPKYKLFDSTLKEYMSLTGDINDSNNGQLIEVYGYSTQLSKQEQSSMWPSSADREGIKVEKYNILSKIPLINNKDSILGKKVQEYLKNRFGCTCEKELVGGIYMTICKYQIDQKISWEYNNNQPILKVIISKNNQSVYLSFDGNKGNLISENISPPTAQFCP